MSALKCISWGIILLSAMIHAFVCVVLWGDDDEEKGAHWWSLFMAVLSVSSLVLIVAHIFQNVIHGGES